MLLYKEFLLIILCCSSQTDFNLCSTVYLWYQRCISFRQCTRQKPAAILCMHVKVVVEHALLVYKIHTHLQQI